VEVELRVRDNGTKKWTDVGHEFITTPNGSWGFYPEYPSPTAPGKVDDDSLTLYTHSKKFSVFPATLKKIEDAIEAKKKAPGWWTAWGQAVREENFKIVPGENCCTWENDILQDAGLDTQIEGDSPDDFTDDPQMPPR